MIPAKATVPMMEGEQVFVLKKGKPVQLTSKRAIVRSVR